MKHTTFFFISLFFLILAFFHAPLYATYPQIFEPINQFVTEVGRATLYVAGFLALVIAVFTWLPTGASVVVFVMVVFGCGWYLKDNVIAVKLDNTGFHLTIIPNQSR